MTLHNYGSEFTYLLFDEYVLDIREIPEKSRNDLINAVVEIYGLLDLRFLSFLFLYKCSIRMMENSKIFYVQNRDPNSDKAWI
jgi:hypothetical protein